MTTYQIDGITKDYYSFGLRGYQPVLNGEGVITSEWENKEKQTKLNISPYAGGYAVIVRDGKDPKTPLYVWFAEKICISPYEEVEDEPYTLLVNGVRNPYGKSSSTYNAVYMPIPSIGALAIVKKLPEGNIALQENPEPEKSPKQPKEPTGFEWFDQSFKETMQTESKLQKSLSSPVDGGKKTEMM